MTSAGSSFLECLFSDLNLGYSIDKIPRTAIAHRVHHAWPVAFAMAFLGFIVYLHLHPPGQFYYCSGFMR